MHLHDAFDILLRAIALDELSGTHKSMAFSRVVTDTDRQIQVERAYPKRGSECLGARAP
jgi:hypothetical protein